MVFAQIREAKPSVIDQSKEEALKAREARKKSGSSEELLGGCERDPQRRFPRFRDFRAFRVFRLSNGPRLSPG